MIEVTETEDLLAGLQRLETRIERTDRLMTTIEPTRPSPALNAIVEGMRRDWVETRDRISREIEKMRAELPRETDQKGERFDGEDRLDRRSGPDQ